MVTQCHRGSRGAKPAVRRPEYLQRRRGRWYVRLRVPAHLVATVGQQHFVRALDTDSETVAHERRWVALALLWEWIGAQTVSDGWEPAWAAGLTGSQRCSDNRAHGHPETSSHDVADHKGQRSPHSQRGSGKQQRRTILALMEQWLKEIEGVQKKQSLLQHALAVREFTQTQPPNCGVLKVDRRRAGEFVSDVPRMISEPWFKSPLVISRRVADGRHCYAAWERPLPRLPPRGQAEAPPVRRALRSAGSLP